MVNLKNNILYGTLKECVDELFKRIDFETQKFPDFDFAAIVEEDLNPEEFPLDPTDVAESWFCVKDLGEIIDADNIPLFIGHYTGGGIESLELAGEDPEAEKKALIARIGSATDSVGLGALKPDDFTMFEFVDRVDTKSQDSDEEKERLRSLLSSALNELYESAEDWYREEIPGLIGSDLEELNKLGVM